MSTFTAPLAPMSAPVIPSDPPIAQFYRLSVAQYHEIARVGILTSSDRVELIEGLLVEKMTKNPPHTLATQLTRVAIEGLLPAGLFVNVQEPLTTTTSEPEPDVSVVRGARRDFQAQHPGPSDVPLVIEVADSSLDYDRTFKNRIYARDRIPVYWIVNPVDGLVEVYTDPTGPANPPDYRQRLDFGPGDSVPLLLDSQEVARIPVRELLP